jgi:hypothetical protein
MKLKHRGPLPEDPKEGDVCPACGNEKLMYVEVTKTLNFLKCPSNMPYYGCSFTFFVRSKDDEIRFLRAQLKKKSENLQKIYNTVQKAMEP